MTTYTTAIRRARSRSSSSPSTPRRTSSTAAARRSCARYFDNDAVNARALEVAEQACMLRWASITDLYRRDYLAEKDVWP